MTMGTLADASDRRTPELPDRIAGLWDLAMDLGWTWDREARSPFRGLDLPLWRMTRHNPVDLLLRVTPERLRTLAENERFLEHYDRVRDARRAAATRPTWFARHAAGVPDGPVAYFCAEFGLHNSVPIYSGGLGVLAGDHCKAASDLGIPLVAVGLFYTRGYFDQALRLDGWQEDSDETFDAERTALEPILDAKGSPCLTSLVSSGREVHVGAWRLRAGRTTIYLLDTDLDANEPADRELSHKLYSGGADLRLRQEGLLGIGGVRVLDVLGIEPRAWHANEGHAAFMLVERVRRAVVAGADLDEAVRQVRASSVFTTHTPVPAGHDIFTRAQIREWAGSYPADLGGMDELLALGRSADPKDDRFHMTAAAIRLSRHVNGVSERHGHVTRAIWHPMWPGRDPEDTPIGHITNGVHLCTWMSNPVMDLLDRHLPRHWEELDDPDVWAGIRDIPDAELWDVHQQLKIGLVDFVREEARRRWRERWREAAHLVGAGTLLSPFPLTIGFARRFASYKRAHLIFRDVERLLELLSNPWQPVQLVFAGKAHPRDEAGKEILQEVYSYTRDSRFEGRIAFLEDYGLHLAHRLVEGVDLWLNLPRVPLEASGTSGMKAALNGVPQLATTDGWWEEGYTGGNGWTIPPADPALPAEEADAADAEHLYDLIESAVIPDFYDRDVNGIPVRWVERMKEAMIASATRFTARRMVEEYALSYYLPAIRGDTAGDDPPAQALVLSEEIRSGGV